MRYLTKDSVLGVTGGLETCAGAKKVVAELQSTTLQKNNLFHRQI